MTSAFHLPFSLACAFTIGDEEAKKEAFDLARSCFQTLLNMPEATSAATFSNFLLCISPHLKKGGDRDQFAEAVFLEGCKRGKVSKQVLDNFGRASPSASNRILSQHERIPVEWGNKINIVQ